MFLRYPLLPALITLLFFTSQASAQAHRDTIYLDADWQKCIRAEASFYRVADKQLSGKYLVRDYYLSGMLQMEGIYADSELSVRYGQFTFYYPSGKRESYGNYAIGFPDGEWKRYYMDGKLKQESFFVRGSKEGLWSTYDSATGKLLMTEEYKNNQLHGKYSRFFPSTGGLNLVRNFRYGWLNGWAINYDSVTGGKLDEGNYKNNERDGVWHFYPWEGHTRHMLEPDRHVYMTYVADEPEGLATYFTPSGTKVLEGTLHHGKRYGKWRRYYTDGTPEYVVECKAGRREGAAVFYDENGHTTKKGTFRNDKEYGVWTFYQDESDDIDHTSTYDDEGNETGPSVLYDNVTGRKIAWGNMLNGTHHGTWTIVFPATQDTEMIKTFNQERLDGYVCYFDERTHNRIIEGYYTNDERSGVWYHWFPRRPDTVLAEIYRSDKSMFVKRYDSFTHRLLETGVLSPDGERDSVWTLYYGDGRLQATSTYLNGDLNGPYKKYDSQTQYILEDGYFLGGKKAGVWKTYFPDMRQLSHIANYKRGLLSGSEVYYYTNGKKKAEGQNVSNKRAGVWRFYDEGSNTLLEQVTYKNGRKNGKDAYFINGKPDHTDTYVDGELVTGAGSHK